MRRLVAIGLVVAAVAAFVLVGWIAGLALLAVAGLGWARDVGRARTALAYETACPRGHVVRQYGVFSCASCGATNESWIWRCNTCGSHAGWTACSECGLAVKNPMFG